MTRFRLFTHMFFALFALALAVLSPQAAHAQGDPQESRRFVVFEAFMRPG